MKTRSKRAYSFCLEREERKECNTALYYTLCSILELFCSILEAYSIVLCVQKRERKASLLV